MPASKRRAAPSEHGIQRAVFDWRKLAVARYPVLNLLHAVPNGAGLRHVKHRRQDGKVTRYSPEAVKLRAEGMTAGVPDVCLPAARGRYHGLYIEHKTKAGRLRPEQRAFIERVAAEGYLVAVSRDSVTTIAVIERYLAQGAYSATAPVLEVPA